MDYTKQYLDQQQAKQLQNRISSFNRFYHNLLVAVCRRSVLQAPTQWVRLSRLYSLLRKRPGKAKILTSVLVETKKRSKGEDEINENK